MESERVTQTGSHAGQGTRMSAAEWRAGTSLAGVFGLRMLGLFFILPVFSVHAPQLAGGDNIMLVGLALGAYGLTQGILQIPFGMASDRWGRKPVLYLGLAIFALGSFLGAAAGNIWTAIAARSLQGAGAISSVAMALAADLTREEHRTKIMAMIGSMIGLMFALSLVGAPLLYRLIGMGGIFALTGFLCLVAMWVVHALVPDAPPRSREPVRGSLRRAILDPELLRLNAGIFVLHVVLYAMFVVVPPLITTVGLELSDHWMLYLPVILASFAVMVPPILYADRRNKPKPVLVGSVALLFVCEAGLAGLEPSLAWLTALMLAFFIAFNILEALIPSLVSRAAPTQGRGTAIAVYNTTQTLGVFFGGLLGGWIASRYGTSAVFAGCAALAAVWLLLSLGMRGAQGTVNELASLTFSIGKEVDPANLREALAGISGVRDVEVLAGARIARLRVVRGQWDEAAVRKLIEREA
jgi:MFS family permease